MRQIDREEYDSLIQKNKFSILQSWVWGQTRKPSWEPIYIAIDETPILILVRDVPFIKKKFGYIPRGFSDQSANKNILVELKNIAKNELKLAYLIIDPNTHGCESVFVEAGIEPNGEPIQPMFTNIVSLLDGPTKIFEKFSSSTRRNIRKFERDHAPQFEIFENSESTALDRFWNIFQTITKRTGFVMHDREYFEKIWEIMGATIAITSDKEGDLAAYFLINNDHTTYELYGGANLRGARSNAGSWHKWRCIEHFSSKTKWYDQWGLANWDGREFDKSHALYGISEFKMRFGGEIVKYDQQMIAVFDSRALLAYKIGIKLNKLWVRVRRLKNLFRSK